MSGWHGKRVLVTGASGFLGAALSRRLLEGGAEVTALVRQTSDLWRLEGIADHLRLRRADLEDGETLLGALRDARPDFVFHAAMSHGHPGAAQQASYLAAVAAATTNLLEALRHVAFERVVALGSSLEYGAAREPLSESRPLAPTTVRGAAKAASSRRFLEFARAERRAVAVLRPFSVYGPWEDPSRFVPKAVASVLAGKPFDLAGPGFRRDPVFVDDVVDACLLIARTAAADGEAVNAGSGRQYTNREIFDAIQAAAGRSVPVNEGAYPPSPSDTEFWVADIARARRLLGWEPAHSLQRGLEKTVAWIADGPERYRQAIPTSGRAAVTAGGGSG